tara:strand:- start:30554 stop:31021 length:468 start_codon:yes stop_codon:yes gene_type:complete
MEEPQKTAVALFNYAHSYAQSALTLEQNETDATHWNAPIYFLYFHAIELYLKSLLVRTGHDLETLRKEHGHKVQPLAELCQQEGLQLTVEGSEVISLMANTDNVISSRYIRVGVHTRFPFEIYTGVCLSLNEQIGWKVYEGSRVTRIPVLRATKG